MGFLFQIYKTLEILKTNEMILKKKFYKFKFKKNLWLKLTLNSNFLLNMAQFYKELKDLGF